MRSCKRHYSDYLNIVVALLDDYCAETDTDIKPFHNRLS